jgi:tetratricopeptide (TPR) repeat protein
MTKIRTERTASGRAIRWLIGLAACAAALVSARHAGADAPSEREQARSHFGRGVQLAKRHSYDAALAEFSRAYELSPLFSVLYNIGQAEVALDRPAEAVQAFERYLAEGAERIDPARRAEVEATLQREAARTGLLEIEVDTSGAQIEVDGSARGTSPLTGPLRFTVGSHRVHVVAPSGRERELTVELSNDNPARVHFELADAPAPAPVAPVAPAPAAQFSAAPKPTRDVLGPTAPPSKSSSDPRKTWAYMLGGAGVALAGAGLIHYTWNAGRHQDWQNQYNAYYLDPRPDRRDTANALALSIERASKLTVGLFVGAGVALGAGSWVLLSSRDGRSQMRASLRSDALVSLEGAF